MNKQAGYSITSGENNTLIGKMAGYSITEGKNNTLVGKVAGESETAARTIDVRQTIGFRLRRIKHLLAVAMHSKRN